MPLGALGPCVRLARQGSGVQTAPRARRAARMAHACANPPEIRRQIVPLASMAATAALAHLGIMDQRVQAALLNMESTEPVLMACRVMAAAAAILGSQAIPARNARLA